MDPEGNSQNHPIPQNAGLTVVRVYPQQGTNPDRSPPIEGRNKQSGDTRKHKSQRTKDRFYHGSPLNNADRGRVWWRRRIRWSGLFDSCNNIAQAFEVCIYLSATTQPAALVMSCSKKPYLVSFKSQVLLPDHLRIGLLNRHRRALHVI